MGGIEKKGADRGMDGIVTFTDRHGELQTVLVSVKSGHVNSAMVRDLKGTLEREKAAIGLFVTLEKPSKEMKLEADTAGLFHSEVWNRDFPRIQLLTIRELLEGKQTAASSLCVANLRESGQASERGGHAGGTLQGREGELNTQEGPTRCSARP